MSTGCLCCTEQDEAALGSLKTPSPDNAGDVVWMGDLAPCTGPAGWSADPRAACGVCAVSPTCFPLLRQGSWLWQPPLSHLSFHLSWWGGSWAEGYEDLSPFSPLFLSVNGIIPALCCHHAPSTICAAAAGFFCALSLHTSLLLSPSKTSPGLLVAACSTGESWLMNLLSVAAVLARNKLLLT